MKLRKFMCGLMAVAGFTACQPEDTNLGVPNIEISVEEMSFDAAGGDQTLTVTATRDWMVDSDYDWVVVSPESGKASSAAQTVTVTVLENTGMDRTADLKFTIGMKSRYLTVNQAGPGGSAEALIVYYNDYDKEVAEKTYGSGTSWPYLDQFDGWMNQTGTGAADVEYAYSGMSARANSTSNSNYSDYAGSGNNNMFFGKSAYLATKNIALGGAKDFTLTFGTEKYSQDNGSVFTKSEFHIFLSKDGNKWVELTDYSFAGDGTEGRWNLASADFSVPSGTDNLSICIKVDVASSYRMDDLRLVIADKAGTSVDFSKAVEMDFTAGGNTGGDATAPESKGKKSVAEFINAADTQNYYELTGKVSGFNPTYCSFDLTDDSGKIYVYSVLDASKSEWASKISNGGTITIYGKYLYYEQKSQHEVVDAYIVSFNGDGGSEEGGNDNPGEAGEYEPQGVTWTLGEKAYDNTSGNNAQTGTVNGVSVSNMLKLGTGSLVGNATLHVAAGTSKIGFYCVAWKGKTAQVKFSVGGTEVTTIEPSANVGATGNPPYASITVTNSDYYEVTLPSKDVTDIKVETLDPSNGRVIFIGLKAITE